MSSNKRICLGIDSEKRQSFSERICDDLCPHILQYLSLEDKLRLECVSKQFQRSIITSQRVISVDFKRNNKNWLIILESLLKKFPNIREVKNPDIYDNKSDYNKAIELIIKYCHKLTHFDFCFEFLSEENTQKVLDQYSLNFDSANFQFIKISEVMDFISPAAKQFFSSLKETNIKKLVSFSPFPELISIKFNRLISLELNQFVYDLDCLELFFGANKSIKYLAFNFMTRYTLVRFKRLLRLTSLLSNLIHLSFKTFGLFGFNEEVLAEEVTQLALNCKQLKSIECFIVLRMSKFTTIQDLLSPLRQFKQLRRLKINFIVDKVPGFPENFKKSLQLFNSFEAFEGFEDLTHLTVCMTNNSESFPESILKDIDIYLPKLQYLCLDFQLKATKWSADILCRLTRLQTTELNIESELLGPNFVSQLQQKCKKIKSIKIYKLFFSPFSPRWDLEDEYGLWYLNELEEENLYFNENDLQSEDSSDQNSSDESSSSVESVPTSDSS